MHRKPGHVGGIVVIKPIQIRVRIPEMNRPRKAPRVESALSKARLKVCPSCRFYQFRAGQHRCLHVARKCERIAVRNPKEVCPIDAWKEAAHG